MTTTSKEHQLGGGDYMPSDKFNIYDLCDAWEISAEERIHFLQMEEKKMKEYLQQCRELGDIRSHNEIYLEWIEAGNARELRKKFILEQYFWSGRLLEGYD